MPRMTGSDAITADTLSAVMDFDSVIRVNTDLTVTTDFHTVYPPEVLLSESASGIAPHIDVLGTGWTLLSGFSGQYSYAGPIMHESEFIGGALAEHILSHTGFYVVVEVRDDNGEFPSQPIGWAVAYLAQN